MTQVRPGKPSNRRALLFRDVNLAWETWPFETFVSSTHSADVLLSRSPERSRRPVQDFSPPFHHKNFSCLRTRFMILISEQTRVNQCPLRGNLPCRKLRRAFCVAFARASRTRRTPRPSCLSRDAGTCDNPMHHSRCSYKFAT